MRCTVVFWVLGSNSHFWYTWQSSLLQPRDVTEDLPSWNWGIWDTYGTWTKFYCHTCTALYWHNMQYWTAQNTALRSVLYELIQQRYAFEYCFQNVLDRASLQFAWKKVITMWQQCLKKVCFSCRRAMRHFHLMSWKTVWFGSVSSEPQLNSQKCVWKYLLPEWCYIIIMNGLFHTINFCQGNITILTTGRENQGIASHQI